jgi:small subunit ribosomal protein S6
MREYELTVVYDLTVAETDGPDAAPQRITTLIEGRGGKMLKVDHWGRRRMAYPINRAIDGDYTVTRVELDPTSIAALEAALKIDERVYRHLIVRADELPLPPPPREPREPRPMPADASAAPQAEAAPAATPVAAAPEPAEAAAEAATDQADPEATPAPATDQADPEATPAPAPAPAAAEAPAEEAPEE